MSIITIYKRGTYYWIQYRINGDRVRKSLSTSNKNVAQRMAKIQERKILLGESERTKGRINLEAFFEKYMEYADSVKRPRTIRTDQYAWKRFSTWFVQIQRKYVDQITGSLFEDFRIYLLNKGLQKTLINITHRHLSSMFSFAVNEGYMDLNPLKKIRLYKIKQTIPKFLSKIQIELIIQQANEHSTQASLVFGLGIFAGLRKNEIANARWEWFDLTNNVITIQPYRDFIPKGHRTRPIPLHVKLSETLCLCNKPEGYLLESPINEETRRNHERFDFKKMFNTVCKKANVEWVTPHVLRHTFASQLALSGVSLYKIQQWLGHSDPKTTMIYAHLQAHDDEINLI